MDIDLDVFFASQLASWTLARDNFAALPQVLTKTLPSGIRVQCNPARIVSTGAKMDAETLRQRRCFLCVSHRPQEQEAIDYGEYQVLVNPYPIFPRHFTIAAKSHTEQQLKGRAADMARLAKDMKGYTIVYNGPHCGASAPDHAHFQAGDTSFLPIWEALPVIEYDVPQACTVFGNMGVIAMRTADASLLEHTMEEILDTLPSPGTEPMVNALMRCDSGGVYTLVVIPRRAHRPSCYGTGEGQMLISPASVDLAGVMVTPRLEDFQKVDDATVHALIAELCYSPAEAEAAVKKTIYGTDSIVSVGIMESERLTLELIGPYTVRHGRELKRGQSGEITFTADGTRETARLTPETPDACVEVKEVTIGVNFHWQQRENQRFKGSIRILPADGKLILINDIHIEEYLKSVISSEMSATSSLELLKAHAVISRSWVVSQIMGKSYFKHPALPKEDKPEQEKDGTRMHIKWYDHDDHRLYDVCADDHCQRYQGITRASTQAVTAAVEATKGEVLMSGDEICDARFSKCCGGVFEQFEYCWASTPKPYLTARRDAADAMDYPDLTREGRAREWILGSPEAFCNTTDTRVLRQVLNHYDQTTTDFYRWQVEYDATTLTELVKRKTGIDFGLITDLQPLQRGTSGRIWLLRIVGEKATMDIGKELEIRRALCETHLYSSAFVVEHTASGFRLKGAGWGHGVGLCQIGAAMMADKGYDYRAILQHYYPGTRVAIH